MALTPEDVRNKQFTTVRFKEGYDLDEVDNFLDEIEESLAAVTREAEDLRATAKGEVPESIREEIRSLGDENARLKSELDQAAKALEDSDARVVVSSDSAASDEALKTSQARVNELESELSSAREELAASLAAITELKNSLQLHSRKVWQQQQQQQQRHPQPNRVWLQFESLNWLSAQQMKQ